MRLTATEILEIQKCHDDPIYFIEKYVKIVNPIYKGEIPFKLYQKQKDFLELYKQNKYTITLKCRQSGFSTVLGALALWMITMHPNRQVLVVSVTNKHAKYFLQEKIKAPYDRLPEFLKASGKGFRNNQNEMFLDNKSFVKSLSSREGALRGYTPNLIIFDEAGFIDDVEELFGEATPSLVRGDCKAVINSTASGNHTWYARTWHEVIDKKQGKEQWSACEIKWSDIDEFVADPEFLKKRRGDYLSDGRGQIMFEREWLNKFTLSGSTLLPPEKLMELRENCTEPIRRDFLHTYCSSTFSPEDALELGLEQTKDGEIAELPYDRNVFYYKGLSIWKDPKKQHSYMLCCDVATGAKGDSSTIQVFDRSSKEQVAEYQNNEITPARFAEVVFDVAKYYDNAFVIIEDNAKGHAVNVRLENELGYYNLYYRDQKRGQLGKIGWDTNTKTRAEMIAGIEDYVLQDFYKINSTRFVGELETFVWKGDKVMHENGCHDDLILPYGMLAVCERNNLIGMPMDLSVIDAAFSSEDDIPEDLNYQPIVRQDIKDRLEKKMNVEIVTSDFEEYSSWL